MIDRKAPQETKLASNATLPLPCSDGTYSACRQNMYRVLEEQGKLPTEDKKPMEVGFTCMVGFTNPMDPEKYPELKDNFSHFKSVVGGDRHGVRSEIRLTCVCVSEGERNKYVDVAPRSPMIFLSL